ncbi:UrcA family protein [Sphingomonas sp. KR3-1]|uniref:UrcA family protein n=1 Tax=Sphingomonas sp. KR3-1 TaxID=3156611 RepID=UPI0032B59675
MVLQFSWFAALSLFLTTGAQSNDAAMHAGMMRADMMHRRPMAVVSTRDLDLSTDSGVRKARARVRAAAIRVCGDYERVGVLPPAPIRRCRTAAVREADDRIQAIAGRRKP